MYTVNPWYSRELCTKPHVVKFFRNLLLAYSFKSIIGRTVPIGQSVLSPKGKRPYSYCFVTENRRKKVVKQLCIKSISIRNTEKVTEFKVADLGISTVTVGGKSIPTGGRI